MYAAILTNTVTMGIEADHPQHKKFYAVCEQVFTTIFTLEMVCKLCTERRYYFYGGEQSNWNCLDFVLAWMSIADVWILSAIGDGNDGMKKFSVVRILRIFRVARMIRLLKMFKELWLIIQAAMFIRIF